MDTQELTVKETRFSSSGFEHRLCTGPTRRQTRAMATEEHSFEDNQCPMQGYRADQATEPVETRLENGNMRAAHCKNFTLRLLRAVPQYLQGPLKYQASSGYLVSWGTSLSGGTSLLAVADAQPSEPMCNKMFEDGLSNFVRDLLKPGVVANITS